jgi:hypothetical protein
VSRDRLRVAAKCPSDERRFAPILLKNSISNVDEKIPAVIGSEPRFRLGGIHQRVGAATLNFLNGLCGRAPENLLLPQCRIENCRMRDIEFINRIDPEQPVTGVCSQAPRLQHCHGRLILRAG